MNANLLLTKRFHLGSNDKGIELETLLATFKKAWDPVPSWYIRRFEQYRLLPASSVAESLDVQFQGLYVTGQGTASVSETHLTMHPVYGIPYLPGTALKGLAAHYSRKLIRSLPEAERLGLDENSIAVLFGSADHGGFIRYHDALPVPHTVSDSLTLDVLTPHHQKYNAMNLDPKHPLLPASPPSDDDNPVLVPFLAARGIYRVMLSCEGDEPHRSEWLRLAIFLLSRALEEEGFGGKVNTGYGKVKIIG